MRSPWLVVALAMTGCYQPSIAPCLYTCSSTEACPDGLACNGDNLCATRATDTCAAAVADAPACTWSGVSNVDPCAIGADGVLTSLTIAESTTVKITTGVLAIEPPPGGDTIFEQRMQLGATEVPAAVLAVGDVFIAGDLVVEGPLPLIILANGRVTISGSVTALSFGRDGGCNPAMDGAPATDSEGAGGGGGGSLNHLLNAGANGGTGGAGEGGLPGAAAGEGGAPVLAAVDLRPMRPGCRGGAGGGSAGMNGLGGGGGGAIQISARRSITLDGTPRQKPAELAANGGGGIGGAGQAGAGGGGSGGAILLEAPDVRLQFAVLCANGGGGGAGAIATGAIGMTGGAGGCGATPASGGGLELAEGSGGRGAAGDFAALAGVKGRPNDVMQMSKGAGGGGGGGGLGIIRINGVVVPGTDVISSPRYLLPN